MSSRMMVNLVHRVFLHGPGLVRCENDRGDLIPELTGKLRDVGEMLRVVCSPATTFCIEGAGEREISAVEFGVLLGWALRADETDVACIIGILAELIAKRDDPEGFLIGRVNPEYTRQIVQRFLPS